MRSLSKNNDQIPNLYYRGHYHATHQYYPEEPYSKDEDYMKGWWDGLWEMIEPVQELWYAMHKGLVASGLTRKEATKKTNAYLGILPKQLEEIDF